MIPSKKVFALILVSILIVAGAFIFAEYKTDTSTYTADTPQTNLIAGTIDSYKDSDGDGLKDWEETLWGTDPKVADADKIKKTQTAIKKSSAPLTATDKMAHSFFSQYMNLKEVGLQNDKDSRDRAAKSLVDTNIEASLPQPYTAASIKVSSAITLRDYGNSVASIIKINSVAKRNELSIFKDALSTENPKFIEELKPSIQGYKNMVSQLLDLRVPADMAVIHLRLVNAIGKISFVIESLSKAFIDPVQSIQALAIFQTSFSEMVAAFSDIVNTLRTANISYTPDEPGYFFTKTK